jgi:hypothetical protein
LDWIGLDNQIKTGLELWYNEHQYDVAMEMWLQHAFDYYYYYYYAEQHDDDYQNSVHARIPTTTTTTTESSQGHHNLTDDDGDPYSIECLEEFWQSPFIRNFWKTSENPNDSVSFHRQQKQQQQQYSLAKLFVFLAGCCLDAGRYEMARKCIFHCFYCIKDDNSNPTNYHNNNNNNNGETITIIENALEEYMASYREEEKHWERDSAKKNKNHHHHSVPSWIVARRVVRLALQLQQQQQKKPNMILRCPSIKWIHEYQRAAFPYRPLLAQQQQHSKPIYHRNEFPSWCFELEAMAPTIQQEFERLWNQQQQKQSSASSSPFTWPCVGGDHRESGRHDGDVVNTDAGGEWRELVVHGTGSIPSHWAPVTERSVPPCVRDLVLAGAGEVIFSVLMPGTHVQPHTASHNLRLTAHLGLRIPQPKEEEEEEEDPSCYLQVADQKLLWKTGKVIVFDDSYEHSVVNDSKEIRAILLLRFWHPALPISERHIALQHVLDSQREDRLRRCNPPIPLNPPSNTAAAAAAETSNVERRRMEQSSCDVCGDFGFESIRLRRTKNTQPTFVCACGHSI